MQIEHKWRNPVLSGARSFIWLPSIVPKLSPSRRLIDVSQRRVCEPEASVRVGGGQLAWDRRRRRLIRAELAGRSGGDDGARLLAWSASQRAFSVPICNTRAPSGNLVAKRAKSAGRRLCNACAHGNIPALNTRQRQRRRRAKLASVSAGATLAGRNGMNTNKLAAT